MRDRFIKIIACFHVIIKLKAKSSVDDGGQGKTGQSRGLLGGGASSKRGIYTLIIFLPVERLVEVGRLGAFRFRRGYYLYTGSALGRGALSLDGRVARHLKKSKRLRWHIDHLLSLEEAQVKAVITVETEERMECEVNKYLKECMNAEVPVPGFGSSDCHGGCGSHLLFLGDRDDPSREVAQLYYEKTGIAPAFRRVRVEASRREVQKPLKPSESLSDRPQFCLGEP